MATSIKDRVRECIRRHPSATVGSIQRYIKKEIGQPCGQGAVLMYLKDLMDDGELVITLRNKAPEYVQMPTCEKGRAKAEAAAGR